MVEDVLPHPAKMSKAVSARAFHAVVMFAYHRDGFEVEHFNIRVV